MSESSSSPSRSRFTDAEVAAVVAELAGHGTGGVNPTREQLDALLRLDADGPFQFLNLLSYHDVARYPDGHELAGQGTTGAEAYGRYGLVAFAHVTKRGGRLALYNDVDQVAIGSEATRWDQVATMEYPDVGAFVDMVRDPDYQSALVHRDAGLADTLVLVTRPVGGGTAA